MQESVQILLATYNGGKFLREQLDSIINQTYQNFTILIRDDGSTDNTLQIIHEYQQKLSGKINLITDDKRNVGASQNFNLLLEKADADYIFFCDQDDIWINNKMKRSIQEIQKLEKVNKETPCLVYADMKAIDEQGKLIANSVWKQLHLHPNFFTLNRLLIQNIPHGCTMLINRAMRDLAFPVPKEAIFHDHWIALLASSCGKSIAINEPLVLLRNHSDNVTRKQTSLFNKLERFLTNSFSKEEYEHFIILRVQQANALLERVGKLINNDQAKLLENFSMLEKSNSLKRKQIFIQNKFYRTTFWHTFKMILRS